LAFEFLKLTVSVHLSHFDYKTLKVLRSDNITSHLTLQKRKVVGNAFNHWAELRSARQNFAENESGLIVESLLNKVRTYFEKNGC
jgi:hypothetical protein